MICVTCRHFLYLMRYDKSATSGRSMSKVITSSDSTRPGLSNDMRRVPSFWIFNQIRKIGDIRRFDSESDDIIGVISARAFEWYASRAAILNIWSDTKNGRHAEVRCEKLWRHRTPLAKGFRMVWFMCRHFLIFDEIQKIGKIRRFDVESDDVIRLISARALEWYASRAAILNI